MVVKTAGELTRLAADVLLAYGAPPEEAQIVAAELVETNLLGFDSHGVLRLVQYVREMESGKIVPGAPVTVMRQTPSTAVVDCGHNFGAVGATRMTALAVELAERSQISCVVSRRCRHIGRLGAYVQQVAERGLIGLAFASGYKGGHCVAPWGGREGRLATNPLAYAVPVGGSVPGNGRGGAGVGTGAPGRKGEDGGTVPGVAATAEPGPPIVFDMATSMIAEGKIRLLHNQGQPVPAGTILDGEGRPTTEAAAFYGPPRGTILPFGAGQGYKGFGLGLLVDILGSTLAGVSTEHDADYTNGFCIVAIDPDAFVGRARFAAMMADLAAYMTSSAPAASSEGVTLPGRINFAVKAERLASGIPIDAETWASIREAAARVGVVA